MPCSRLAPRAGGCFVPLPLDFTTNPFETPPFPTSGGGFHTAPLPPRAGPGGAAFAPRNPSAPLCSALLRSGRARSALGDRCDICTNDGDCETRSPAPALQKGITKPNASAAKRGHGRRSEPSRHPSQVQDGTPSRGLLPGPRTAAQCRSATAHAWLPSARERRGCRAGVCPF